MRIHWPQQPKEWIHFLLHGALPLFYLVLGVRLVAAVQTGNRPECAYDLDYLPDWSLAAIGLVGLLAGRNISQWGRHKKYVDDPTNKSAKPGVVHRSTVLWQGALVSVFALLAAIWFLEAIGTSHVRTSTGAEFEPITWYVRCAIYHDRATSTLSFGPWTNIGVWTSLVVFVICYTAGHWLWAYHPTLRKKMDSVDTTTLHLDAVAARAGREPSEEGRPRRIRMA
jgi:hypothetical protein